MNYKDNIMTLRELRDKLNKVPESELDGNISIRIYIKGSIGPIPTSQIHDLVQGVDWNSGQWMILTKDPLTVREDLFQGKGY